MNYIYEGSFSSTMEEAHEFLTNLIKELNIIVHNQELFQDIRLIISELVVNGTLHGNLCDCSKQVFVRLNISPKKIWIQVEDEGKGILPCCSQEILSESGRGLKIVEHLSDFCNIDENQITVEIFR